METKGIRVKKGVPQKRYSEAFKKMVVREYEQGVLSKDWVQKKYGIGGKSRILTWCRKYGKLWYSKKVSVTIKPIKDLQKRRIQELEKLLAEERLNVIAYKKLIEVAEREEGISITKKGVTKRSKN
jgi:transposase